MGSEMCIRDRSSVLKILQPTFPHFRSHNLQKKQTRLLEKKKTRENNSSDPSTFDISTPCPTQRRGARGYLFPLPAPPTSVVSPSLVSPARFSPYAATAAAAGAQQLKLSPFAWLNEYSPADKTETSSGRRRCTGETRGFFAV